MLQWQSYHNIQMYQIVCLKFNSAVCQIYFNLKKRKILDKNMYLAIYFWYLSYICADLYFCLFSLFFCLKDFLWQFFSAFVCLGRCQNLESLKFFLKMPILPQRPYSVFSIPNPSRAHCPWVVLGAMASPLVWQDNEWNSVLLFIQSSAMISHVTFSFSWRGLSCYFN